MSMRVEGISFAYKKAALLLENASLRAENGRIAALLGPNGAGKTTIIRLLLGLLKPKKGTIEIDGKPIDKLRRKELSSMVAYLPQAIDFASESAIEAVLMGRLPYSPFVYDAQDEQAAIEALRTVGMEGLAFAPCDRLSGGERQKIALARLLSSKADNLILDEPTSALDVASAKLAKDLLLFLAKQGKSILVSLHDIHLAYELADSFYLLHSTGLMEIKEKENLTEEALKVAYGEELKLVKEGDELFVSYH